MATYIRKPHKVEAFKFDKSAPRDRWPDWAKAYRGRDALGSLSPMGVSVTRVLTIPANGGALNATDGQYVVLDGTLESLEDGAPIVRGTIAVIGGAEFEATHDLADEG